MARPIRGARELKATQDQLHSVDDQISKLWVAYRRWFDGGTTSKASALSPVDALEAIDHLLETRHGITCSQGGEMLHPDDTAQISDWGHAG